MKLFLTSKGLINEEIKNSFLSFVAGKTKVSIITTAASVYKEKNKNNVGLKEKLEALGFSVQFVDLELEPAERLSDSQIIVISGGNPYYLLYHLRKSKADVLLKERIKNNTPLMGISAGSLVLMENLDIIDCLTPEMNSLKLQDKSGLNLIDEIIVPHYDRFVKEGRIKQETIDAFEAKTQRQVTRLGEYQCLKYENDEKEWIGEYLP